MLYPPKYGNDPLLPKSSDFAIVEKDSSSGKGVIAFRGFERGTIIAKMSGEVVTDIRQHTLQIDATHHLYDIYFSGYFLHSCDPNIYLDMQNRTVKAIKKIKPNSYLYMDYAQTEDVLFRQFPCSCDARNCRGWITGRKELPIAVAKETEARIFTSKMPIMSIDEMCTNWFSEEAHQ